jgi:ubiquinone/menaquinone biosynthesis C-methylase UbiE
VDQAAYAVESQIEQTHWWFVVRRALFRKTIEAMKLPPSAAILDAGTSTGSNLRMLRAMDFTNFQGLDLSDDAIRWCAEKGLGVVRKGDICRLPFADSQFDLVLATDIVEHVDHDVQALQEICRVLKPSGRAIITVPAFESLWGSHDTVLHHKRRYTRGELLDKLNASGCRTYESYYFNYLLFVPIWIARKLIQIFKPKLGNQEQINSPLINAVLKVVFTVDVTCAKTLRVPFGVSIFALVGKNGSG